MTWVAATDAAIADAIAFQKMLDCQLWLRENARPPTEAESTAGRQTYAHGDHQHLVSIGWRREQELAERIAEDQAAMAACPYVACTCGHHEE